MNLRTDLAMEDHALWRRSAKRQTKLSGVRAREETEGGVKITSVEILDEEGERALGKPRGTYVTLECARARTTCVCRAVRAAVRGTSAHCFPPGAHVLVAGLGNEAVTPDAVGPEALRNLIVTARHLKRTMPEVFAPFSTVSAIAPGVLGTTGMESAELLAAAVRQIQPDAVIAVDAVASCEPERLCGGAAVHSRDHARLRRGERAGGHRPDDPGRPGIGHRRTDGDGSRRAADERRNDPGRNDPDTARY